jgi:hypothetical protein
VPFDSYAGLFTAEGRTLSFDWGTYSNPLVPLPRSEFQAPRACRQLIGGRVARLVAARRGTLYFAGAAWRDVEPAPIDPTHFTIMVTSNDSLGQAEGIQILRSVRFRSPQQRATVLDN